MWFCKWFRRDKDENAYEPAAHAPPAAGKTVNGRPAPAPKAASARASNPKPDYGFDPYNSGAFEKRKAWERISRR